MKRFLNVATTVSLLSLLTLGLTAPHSDMMLLASAESGFAIVRGGLAALLIALLIYQPPRRPEFRISLVGIATMLVTWSSMILVASQTNVLDALLFMEIAILLYIEAAELTGEVKSAPSTVQLKSRKQRRIVVQTAS